MQVKMVPLRVILSYFLPHIGRYKWTFYIPFIGFGISYILGGIVQPLFYREMIDVITTSGNNVASSEKIIRLIWMIAGIIILKNVIHRSTDFVYVYAQSKIIRDLNNYVFTKLQNQSYQFFVNSFAGSLVAKTRRFVRAFEVLQDNLAFSFWSAIIQLFGIFIVLFVLAPGVALFFAVWCILFIAITVFLINKKRQYDLIEAAADSKKTGGLADAITGVLNIKMFSSIRFEIERFRHIADNEERARRASWNFGNLIHVVHSISWTIMEIVGLYLMVVFWTRGQVTAGTIVLLITYFAIISGIMWNLRGAIGNFMRAISDSSEMVEILERKPEILDIENPEPCRIREGCISFNNVTFSYSEGDDAIFRNFNLKIEAKEKVGLVGPSGGGKSTTTKLLLRFLDITDGSITIDGQDISKMGQAELRSKIAYVPQDPILFHRSLRENIAYSCPDATDDEIIEVAKKANAHEFIARLPHGYGTFVGERGVKLSGGERQRVAIARAMLKDAPILILDEATSSLDSLSEKSVMEAFRRLIENKTTIIIAHRLSTIRKMKRIIVLDGGVIVEEGSHLQLVKNRGLYYEMWDSQRMGFAA